MAGPESTAEELSRREIHFNRVFDAPRELVFAAFTRAEHIARWWGPRGFTTTTHQMDVRPGGVWRFTMHGPDGTDFPNRVDYLEVAPPERLVYHHSDDSESEGIRFDVTITFTERQGRTELDMRMRFATAAERDRVVEEYGAVEGGQQTLDRLGEFLAEQRGGAA